MPRQLTALRAYARKLGLAFQVTDDLLDIEASSDQIGKRTQKDQTRGKATYPALYGVERSRDLAQVLVQQALDAISSFGAKAAPLRALAHYAVERRL
jgi:geranylgeranyl pyrophosphate synthase